MNVFKTYTGADATLEILIMLFVSFLLGALLMWLYEHFLVECVDEDDEYKDNNIIEEKKDVAVEEKTEDADIEKEILKNEFLLDNNNESLNREDDLKIIEGIGPKIEALLKSAGLDTWEKIANTPVETIKDILKEKGGERYAFHNPLTWPEQAKLASEGKM